MIATPFLFLCLLLPREINIYLFWFLCVVVISNMSLCWTLVADVLLYVVEPERRAMASAMNILICHLLGDAISPYVIGAVIYLFSSALRTFL